MDNFRSLPSSSLKADRRARAAVSCSAAAARSIAALRLWFTSSWYAFETAAALGDCESHCRQLESADRSLVAARKLRIGLVRHTK